MLNPFLKVVNTFFKTFLILLEIIYTFSDILLHGLGFLHGAYLVARLFWVMEKEGFVVPPFSDTFHTV
jgi:hypothetical protein